MGGKQKAKSGSSKGKKAKHDDAGASGDVQVVFPMQIWESPRDFLNYEIRAFNYMRSSRMPCSLCCAYPHLNGLRLSDPFGSHWPRTRELNCYP